MAVQPWMNRPRPGHAYAAADLPGEVDRRGRRAQVAPRRPVLHDQDHDLQEQAEPRPRTSRHKLEVRCELPAAIVDSRYRPAAASAVPATG